MIRTSQTQGWDDEQALGEDMKEEREREEEIKRSEKEMKELLSQRRYRQRILNAEVDKVRFRLEKAIIHIFPITLS